VGCVSGALFDIIKELISIVNYGSQKKKPLKKPTLNHQFFGNQKPRTCRHFIWNIKKNGNRGSLIFEISKNLEPNYRTK
jgi:hypothetical protein